MRAHYLQHVAFEGLGSIEPWLLTAGFELSSTRFFESSALPDLDGIDLLIVMGGPMSVHDEDRLPWLRIEKEFIRRAVEGKKAVLGVCLGAQLVACAMGARVTRNPKKEIGWFPIEAVQSSDPAVFRFRQSVEVFHWHGETFDLPLGAVLIARSEACTNQGFQLGDSVIGLQFHLETTPESARELTAHCRDELVPDRYIQSEQQILDAPPEKYRTINNLMDGLLSFLTQRERRQTPIRTHSHAPLA